jgi:hypothetical protein
MRRGLRVENDACANLGRVTRLELVPPDLGKVGPRRQQAADNTGNCVFDQPFGGRTDLMAAPQFTNTRVYFPYSDANMTGTAAGADQVRQE